MRLYRVNDILERLIYEQRTWVNQVSSWEKVRLCQAGLMSVQYPTDYRGKSLYHIKPIYLWTEAGRMALGETRATLLEREGAA